MASRDLEDCLAGVLLGTAVGDALGLPREGLSPQRARRLFGPVRHALIFNRGMVSDDTDHTCLVGSALIRENRDPHRFARHLAAGLRGWFASLPAGVGLATARACIRLWLGFPPTCSGVHSAGNGPAMRAALLGACLGDDAPRLHAFIRASTRLTHTDPRAEQGAMLVALAAWHASQHGVPALHGFMELVHQRMTELDGEFQRALHLLQQHLDAQASAADFAAALGLTRGVTGYMLHTVPVVLFCWLRFPDFRTAMTQALELGGDTDTVGAILGGIVGASTGASGIPTEWVAGITEWPRSVRWMEELSRRLALSLQGHPQRPPSAPWPALLLRNLLFLPIVLGHGFRRLLPPYG